MHIEVETNNVIGALGTLAQLLIAPAQSVMLHKTWGSARMTTEEVAELQQEVARHRIILAEKIGIPDQKRLSDAEFMDAARRKTATQCHIPPEELVFLRSR
jgi:hypothetical protein